MGLPCKHTCISGVYISVYTSVYYHQEEIKNFQISFLSISIYFFFYLASLALSNKVKSTLPSPCSKALILVTKKHSRELLFVEISYRTSFFFLLKPTSLIGYPYLFYYCICIVSSIVANRHIFYFSQMIHQAFYPSYLINILAGRQDCDILCSSNEGEEIWL